MLNESNELDIQGPVSLVIFHHNAVQIWCKFQFVLSQTLMEVMLQKVYTCQESYAIKHVQKLLQLNDQILTYNKIKFSFNSICNGKINSGMGDPGFH